MFQKLYELSAIFIAKLLYYEISQFARTFHRQISTFNICCFTLSLSYHIKNSVCKFLNKNLLYLFSTFSILSFYYKHHIYFFHFLSLLCTKITVQSKIKFLNLRSYFLTLKSHYQIISGYVNLCLVRFHFINQQCYFM